MKVYEHPKVSVVMATFNRGPILRQSVREILKQDYRPLELIIINDGSTDDTRIVLDEFKTHPNIMVINNQQNLGLQKSLNKGLQKVTGKYIARIDDHDLWLTTNKLSKQVTFLEKHPGVGVVGTSYRVGNKNMINRLTDGAIRKQMLFRSPFCHVTVLMRKQVVDEVGGYDEKLPYSEDWDLWMRIGKVSQLANLPDITTAVKPEEDSLTNHYFLKQLPINKELVKMQSNHYPNAKLAFLYHQFIQLFFTFVPINGVLHSGMKKIFQFAFYRK